MTTTDDRAAGHRGPGRPPIGPRTGVRFRPVTRAALDATADLEALSVAEVVRRIVDAYYGIVDAD